MAAQGSHGTHPSRHLGKHSDQQQAQNRISTPFTSLETLRNIPLERIFKKLEQRCPSPGGLEEFFRSTATSEDEKQRHPSPKDFDKPTNQQQQQLRG
jgi:hypothetical protein